MSDTLTAPFAQANKPTVQIQSPFELMRAAGENARLMNDNRLFQAQQAAGLAQQNAIDPATGQYSPDKFRQNLLAAGPVAAPAVQSAMGANQSLSSDQLNQARDKMGWIAKASQDALTKGDFSDGAMLKTLMQGNANNILTIPEIAQQLQQLPPDPAGRKAWLEQHQAQALSSQQHLDLQYGVSGTEIGPDGRRVGTKQKIQTGAVTQAPGQGVQTGPSAESLSEVSTITNPDNSTSTDTKIGHQKAGRITPLGTLAPGYTAATASPGMVTALRGQEATPDGRTSVAGARGQMQVTPGFFKQYAKPGESFDSHADVEAVANRGIAVLEAKYPNDPGRVATAYFSGEGNVAPPGSKTPYIKDTADANGTLTSKYVAGVIGRYKPEAGAAKTPPGPKDGGTTVPANLGKLQGASIDHYVADSRESHGYQDRMYPLQQAAKALETAKTGEGSDVLQSIASRIQTLTPDALKNIMPNIRTPEEIAAYDEGRKYLTMAQQNRPGAGRTDAADRIAGDSSPSMHIAPMAAKLLVQAQMGVERSKQAQLLEFNATHPQGTEGEYDRWLTTKAAQVDPRAFITDSQTPAQRKSYYDRLGETEKQNYLDSYALAKKHKLLTLPNGG